METIIYHLAHFTIKYYRLNTWAIFLGPYLTRVLWFIFSVFLLSYFWMLSHVARIEYLNYSKTSFVLQRHEYLAVSSKKLDI